MEIKINLPDYDPKKGFEFHWEEGSFLETKTDENGTIHILANKEGLLTLAHQLFNLAQDQFPSGHHLHFDSYTSLAEGSSDLIIEKYNV